MRIDTAFPGAYLKAADLQGRAAMVVMDRVEVETVGDEPKPVLYFQGKSKGLVLNKTNSNAIATAYGYETDAWHGQQVQLVEAMVDFQGRSVPAIRIRVTQTARAQVAAPSVHPQRSVNGVQTVVAPQPPDHQGVRHDRGIDLEEIPF